MLLITSAASMVLALAIAFLAGEDRTANFVLIFLFAAFAMPVYSLAAAHANDFAGKGGYVKVAAALMFFYSIGAIVGPLVLLLPDGAVAAFMRCSIIRPRSYAAVRGGHHLAHGRAVGAAAGRRGRFAALLRTSPIFAKLAYRGDTRPKPPVDGQRIRLTRPRPCLNWNGIREAKRSEIDASHHQTGRVGSRGRTARRI